MPILSALVASLFGKLATFLITAFGVQWGVRLAVATALGTGYVALVATFTGVIAPWIGSVFTTSYGMLLGLLFPPVAGTVLASLVLLWAAVIAYRYSRLLLDAVK